MSNNKGEKMKPTTEEQREEFKKLTEPVMKWLCDNFHPHVTVIIEPSRAELLEGQCAHVTDKYVGD